MSKKKSFDAQLDELLSGIDLPSDEELVEETRKAKISQTTEGRQKPAGFKEKLSASKKGKPLSDEHLAAVRASSEKRRGTKLSEEHKAKVSAAITGREVSEETRAKIGAANKGRKLPPKSDETRAKASAALKGKPGRMTGKTHSEEAKAKMRAAHVGKEFTEEHRAKISEGKKGKAYGGNFKPVKTPYGVFSSLKEAGDYEETITGRKFNPNRFTKLLKDPDSGYKRITPEEYIKLV